MWASMYVAMRLVEEPGKVYKPFGNPEQEENPKSLAKKLASTSST